MSRSKYETHVKPHLDEIPKWYGEMTERQIAKRLGVGPTSWAKYKAEHPELVEKLVNGREVLVEDLKKSLKMKAKGFRYTETKKTIREVAGKKTTMIEEYERYSPPDTGAIHLLLKNYDDSWRNDDKATMDLKREELELKKKKIESEVW